MSYTTDFKGKFNTSRLFTENEIIYLNKFNQIRHMKRNVSIIESLNDFTRKSVGLPIGHEGAYYVNNHNVGIIDVNEPPEGVPGLWCQWKPTEDRDSIAWDGNEQFYSYVKWIKYIIEHFLTPWDILLDGKIYWWGEEFDDLGEIIILDNVVTVNKFGVK